eukprot:CAMPEP_0194047768 /NCGR_PEP_ID=MMETSP0009_2-20130614/25456_1 /TAXON_ID=210454 /ORGANISM="Grammatophora oceanica, Strain CCMP 410" /LENGTH=93 /DNA_ID=CAMNT_0038693475 /DNA_START=91 /DNA_END=369 /DNA_ORIENTATION=+
MTADKLRIQVRFSKGDGERSFEVLSSYLSQEIGDDNIVILPKKESSALVNEHLLEVTVLGSGEGLFSSDRTMNDDDRSDLKEQIEDLLAEQNW